MMEVIHFVVFSRNADKMFHAKAATTLQRRVICSLVSVSVEE